MSENNSKTAVWLSDSDLDFLFVDSRNRSMFADLLLDDIAKGTGPSYTAHAKLLLREIYCLIESNLSFFDESLRKNPHKRDGVDGYVLTEADLLSLTTFSLTMKKISSELLEQGICLETQ